MFAVKINKPEDYDKYVHVVFMYKNTLYKDYRRTFYEHVKKLLK